MNRRLLCAVLALVAAGALAACGERSEPTGPAAREPVRLMLDYFPNADHAGIYAALGTGAFDRAGIDLDIQTPSDPAAPLKLLAAGRVDLAISYEPELLLARDQGQKLVAVGAIVQKPLTSLVSIGRNAITSPAQLAGKTVGTAGIPYQSAYLKAILSRAGVDPASVKEVNVGFNLTPAMLSRKVDATLGAFWNYEALQLQLDHKRPRVIRMENAGVPTYNELVVVAREADVRENGAKVRRFMRALGQGMSALRKDPETGLAPLLKANRDLERDLQAASVKATMPVFFPADSSKPFGYMDPVEWTRYGDWMARNRLLRNPPAAGRALTNEFLPGEGV
ncbi:MAG: putative hydroxymethylpyrimidine transport system substrate-binding protein [Solirubrobacteraceae bacterium]|jgi:putative hydroxymethylpyrimidine transport system substrate-binding protein|nr:putative hydroxymethylpyrimidine transport system substrate-binding protein [Solirubrobacteraceae bacterium]